MSQLQHDLVQAAQGVARALSGAGYKADFLPASLAEIDRFFDEHTVDGQARPNGLLSVELGARLFGLGGYIGEVIRLAKGGEWLCDDHDPDGAMKVQLRTSDGQVCFPVQRTMKRFRNGREDGIAVWGAALGAVPQGGRT